MDKTAESTEREQTDESLRAEREKADVGVEEKRKESEKEADDVMRVARERADALLQAARDDTDRQHPAPSTASAAMADRERARADEILAHERANADAVLELDRAERKRYLADFLAVEREATDVDLVGERAHSDSVIDARDQFLATVSHDLRGLLGTLTQNAELLLALAPAGPEGDPLRKQGTTAQRFLGRMNRLVGDLLDTVAIQAGKLAILPEQIELSKIVSDTLDAYQPVAAAKGVALDADTNVAEVPLHVLLDGGRILQVLANLVSNAIKFTPRGGRVRLQIRRNAREIELAVVDNGIGIAAAVLPQLFERFRQARYDRRGLGLGLYISKCIVEAHGGRMWAESELGAGSTFHVTLPVPLLPADDGRP